MQGICLQDYLWQLGGRLTRFVIGWFIFRWLFWSCSALRWFSGGQLFWPDVTLNFWSLFGAHGFFRTGARSSWCVVIWMFHFSVLYLNSWCWWECHFCWFWWCGANLLAGKFVQAVKSIHLLVFLWCAVCFLLEWYAYASVLIVFDFTTWMLMVLLCLHCIFDLLTFGSDSCARAVGFL